MAHRVGPEMLEGADSQEEEIMTHIGFRMATKTLAILAMSLILAAVVAAAPTETVLHLFTPSEGADLESPLVFDGAGNLFGTTYAGGQYALGTVYELSPIQGGGWTLTVLYNFTGGADGDYPLGGVILDASGNLYGTTGSGGTSGHGVVYKLTSGMGGWTQNVLYTFTGGNDGGGPYGEVVFDAAGNLYGTTNGYGAHMFGVVYELTPSGGSWTQTVLHAFAGGKDGDYPIAGLTLDRHGNLFGMTAGGVGTAYKLTHSMSGRWHYHFLFDFGGPGAMGQTPQGTPALDPAGHIFGATYSSSNAKGLVFELSSSHGLWTEKVLYQFTNGPNGSNPAGAVVLDGSGNVYGTTQQGGTSGTGVAFKLTHHSGSWTQSVLHTFPTGADDGEDPSAAMIFDAAGNLYGTTLVGFGHGGVVFEITP